MKPKVIAVLGPTASGKSSLGAFLARKLGGVVVSADSRQVYRGIEVISRSEPGYMVSIADPRRKYSAGTYAKDAAKVLKKIERPIVVGGTGFYADALLRAPLPQVKPNAKLRAILNKKTPAQLVALLARLDPASAKRVDPHNKVRLVRAIEIAKALGKVPERSETISYETLWLGLPIPKNYEKILVRGVEERLRRGMVAEAKKLRATLSKKRFSELGFEFDLLAGYLDKKISKQELIDGIVRGELGYAKRQMRWFKRHPEIHWVKNKTEALQLAKSFLSR